MTHKTTLHGGSLDGTAVEIQADSIPKSMTFGEDQYVLVMIDVPHCAQKRTVFLHAPDLDPVKDGEFVAGLLGRLTRDWKDPDDLVDYQVELRQILEPVWSWFNSDEHDEKPLLQVVKEVVEELQEMSRQLNQHTAREARQLAVSQALEAVRKTARRDVLPANGYVVGKTEYEAYLSALEEFQNG